MIGLPGCRNCNRQPRLTLIGPKGIALEFPGAFAIAGDRELITRLLDELGIKARLDCPNCRESWIWDPRTSGYEYEK